MTGGTAWRGRVDVEQALAALGVAALTLLYVLRNGTYDVVARGELAVLVWVALGLGWAVGLLPRLRPARILWPAVAGFLLLAVWTTVCLSWTESDERTVVELGRVAHHAGIFLLAASLVTRRSWAGALAGLLAGATIACWLGLLNWLWPASLATDFTRTVFGVNRLSYPLGYFNGMAALGAMTLVAGLAWSAHARAWWLRAAAIAPMPGVALMTYLTYSRGGALELACGLLVVVAFARHRLPTLLVGLVAAAGSVLAILVLRDHQALVEGRGSAGASGVLAIVLAAGLAAAAVAALLAVARADDRLRLPPRLGRPVLAVAAVVAVVAVAVAVPRVVDRASRSGESPVDSASNPTARFTTLGSARQPQFRAALDIWREHPLEGTGPGTFEFAWNRSPRYSGFVRDVHDLYLEALAESGWPGLLLLLVTVLGLVAIVVAAAVRARGDGPARGAATAAAAVLAVFLVAAAVDWVWELTALAAIALIAVGATAGGLGLGRYRGRLRPGRVVVPVAAILAVLAVLPPVVSTSAVRSSQASARASRPADALREAGDAIDVAPWSASAIAQKALLLEAAGRLRRAEGYAALAAEREPANWRYPLLRARIAARRGDAKRAVALFRAARALAPLNAALQ